MNMASNMLGSMNQQSKPSPPVSRKTVVEEDIDDLEFEKIYMLNYLYWCGIGLQNPVIDYFARCTNGSFTIIYSSRGVLTEFANQLFYGKIGSMLYSSCLN